MSLFGVVWQMERSSSPGSSPFVPSVAFPNVPNGVESSGSSSSSEGGIQVSGSGSGTARWPYDNSGHKDILSKYSPSYYKYYSEDGSKKTLLLPFPKPIILPPPMSNTPMNSNIMLVSKPVNSG
jgi:hypothetical protein